jgi:pSer/pThr/pTyr-binding forkhead associated (FHA) protein/class 3 adenylate cyclase
LSTRRPEVPILSIALLIIDQDGSPHWVGIHEGATRIGRGSDNDLVLTGRGVSRHHASLELDAGVLTVRDLDSTYGTRVTGEVIRKKRVGVGDPIDVGVFRLVPLPESALEIRRHAPRDVSREGTTPNPFSGETKDFSTSEFSASTNSGVRVLMSAPRFVGERDNDWSGQDETTLHGLVEKEESTEELPVNVQLVDGWGSDALARVLTAGAEGLIAETEGSQKRKLESYRKALEVLNKLAKIAASNESRRVVLKKALDLIATVVHMQTAVVLEVLEGGKLKPLAIRHHGELKRGELPVSRSVIQRAVRERAPVISENLAKDPEYGAKDSVHMYRVGAVLALPMRLEEQVVGVLYMTRPAGESFADAEVAVVRVVAGLGSGVLRAARLQNEAHARKSEDAQLKRFISPVVRERVQANPTEPYFLENRPLTVLFARLLDLSRVVAALKPADLVSFFADFHTALRDVTKRNGGECIYANRGEALVAFGIPEPSRTDANWAVNAALELAAHFETTLQRRSGPSSGLSVALSSGEGVWGVVGSPAALEHAALGQPVDVAIELADCFGEHGVVITESTLNAIPKPRFNVEPFQPESPPETVLPRAFRILPRRSH